MRGWLTYTVGVRAMAGVLTVKTGREFNRKLAVSYLLKPQMWWLLQNIKSVDYVI